MFCGILLVVFEMVFGMFWVVFALLNEFFLSVRCFFDQTRQKTTFFGVMRSHHLLFAEIHHWVKEQPIMEVNVALSYLQHPSTSTTQGP